MTKAQWKAIYDFCEDNGFYNPHELLIHLKRQGSVDRKDALEDLGEYPENKTYDGMIKFLSEEV